VARLVGDQLQEDEAKLARFEHPPASASAAPAARSALEIPIERAPAAASSAADGHGEEPSGDANFNAAGRPAAMIMMSM